MGRAGQTSGSSDAGGQTRKEGRDRLAAPRKRMIDLLRRRGIASEAVLSAMQAVPREAFVPGHPPRRAYEDGPLPIEQGQTVSQPYIVALMIEAAGVVAGARVLEVGTGSGYSAAVMAHVDARVISVERHAVLAGQARERLRRMGYDVAVETGDGTLGRSDEAPFDCIVVAAGGPKVPEALRLQLAVGGRLVMPVGSDTRRQSLLRLTRQDEETFDQENLGAVAFVPLVGHDGWPS